MWLWKCLSEVPVQDIVPIPSYKNSQPYRCHAVVWLLSVAVPAVTQVIPSSNGAAANLPAIPRQPARAGEGNILSEQTSRSMFCIICS